jgi:hypothetical protein
MFSNAELMSDKLQFVVGHDKLKLIGHRHDGRESFNPIPQILYPQVLILGVLIVIVVSNRHSHCYRRQIRSDN